MRSVILKLYRILFAHAWAAKFNYLLFDCASRGFGILNYESDEVSGEAFLVRELLPKLLPRSPAMFDVGANVGRYSAALVESFADCSLHAFEPNPKSYSKLVTAIGHRAVCINKGLSDAAGTLVLFDRADQAGSEHASVYGNVISELHKAQPVATTVSMTTLDSYCAEYGISRIDLLKIDTEGHELTVLKGAQRMLAERRLGIIQIEFNEMNTLSRTFYRDFLGLLPHHKIFRLLPNSLLVIRQAPFHQELFAFQNLIAIPHEIIPRLHSKNLS